MFFLNNFFVFWCNGFENDRTYAQWHYTPLVWISKKSAHKQRNGDNCKNIVIVLALVLVLTFQTTISQSFMDGFSWNLYRICIMSFYTFPANWIKNKRVIQEKQNNGTILFWRWEAGIYLRKFFKNALSLQIKSYCQKMNFLFLMQWLWNWQNMCTMTLYTSGMNFKTIGP